MKILSNSAKYLVTVCTRGRQFYARKKLAAIPETQARASFNLAPNVKIELTVKEGKIAIERGGLVDRVIVSSNKSQPEFKIAASLLDGGEILDLTLTFPDSGLASAEPISPSSSVETNVYLLRPSQFISLRLRTSSGDYIWDFRYLTTDDYCREFI